SSTPPDTSGRTHSSRQNSPSFLPHARPIRVPSSRCAPPGQERRWTPPYAPAETPARGSNRTADAWRQTPGARAARDGSRRGAPAYSPHTRAWSQQRRQLPPASVSVRGDGQYGRKRTRKNLRTGPRRGSTSCTPAPHRDAASDATHTRVAPGSGGTGPRLTDLCQTHEYW